MSKAALLILGSGTSAPLGDALLDPKTYRIVKGIDSENLVQIAGSRRIDLIILHCGLNDACNPIALVREIRAKLPTIPVLFLTERSSEELAIQALRCGVADYLKAPFDSVQVLTAVDRCLSQHGEKDFHDKTTTQEPVSSDIIGHSSAIQEVREYIQKVAITDANVLITGETGTGKELIAQSIHKTSTRRNKPFVSFNSAAIPDSLFESELFGHNKGAFTGADGFRAGKIKFAEGGTIFFDEIGDMSPYAQAKILRCLETRLIQRLGSVEDIPFNVRVIAATNQNIDQLITEGRFRKDLYYRLNVARVHLPPLRERKEDVGHLISHYLDQLNKKFDRDVEGVSREVLELLLRYDWPGNIRELKNLMEAIFILGPSSAITFDKLPLHYRGCLAQLQNAACTERDRLLFTLSVTNWNKSLAAQKLQWSRMTLYRKMAKYHIVSHGLQNKAIL